MICSRAVVVVVAAVVVVAVAKDLVRLAHEDEAFGGSPVLVRMRRQRRPPERGADLVPRGLARYVEHATRGGRVQTRGTPARGPRRSGRCEREEEEQEEKEGRRRQRPTPPHDERATGAGLSMPLERDPAPPRPAFLAEVGASQPGHPRAPDILSSNISCCSSSPIKCVV